MVKLTIQLITVPLTSATAFLMVHYKTFRLHTRAPIGIKGSVLNVTGAP